jgi:hypothetical protein
MQRETNTVMGMKESEELEDMMTGTVQGKDTLEHSIA